MTEASKEAKVIFVRVAYIHYTLHFYKDKKNKMQALIDSNSKINIIMY